MMHSQPVAQVRRQRGVQRLIVWIVRHHGPEGVLAATVPSGAGVLGVVSVLAVFLILYFVS